MLGGVEVDCHGRFGFGRLGNLVRGFLESSSGLCAAFFFDRLVILDDEAGRAAFVRVGDAATVLQCLGIDKLTDTDKLIDIDKLITGYCVPDCERSASS
jgi:hypothetical protein